MDFVHDQLATGKKIRVLTVCRHYHAFSPIIDPRFCDRIVAYPQTIRVD
jgi:hypothetical protein